MAGTVVHLLVALNLYERFCKEGYRYAANEVTEIDKDYFVAGNICPDGIMARENYQRAMKLHTHFRDGIPDGAFQGDEVISLFRKRMRDFWDVHQEEEKTVPGLYLGYVTHMMVDERFILEEREKFFERIGKVGMTVKDRETFQIFARETDLVDFRLVAEKEKLKEAKECLERVPEYEISGMITKDELSRSRMWILQHFFYHGKPGEDTKYLLYEDMLRFVDRITEEIGERVIKEGYLVKKS